MSCPDANGAGRAVDAKRIEELYHAAAELPAGDQAEFLARGCAGDENLQATVMSLLTAGREAPQAWDRGALEMEARHSALDMPLARPDEFFGPYRILRCIAAGGMGLVYEALRDDPEFQKRVAIKLVQQGLDDPASVERFRSERQILAQLEHPNIARLLDGGTTRDGVPYLVMEYVDGERIDRFAAGRSLTRNERLKLFLAVCEAVQHAHQNLIVHRDLKPGNILVTPDGAPKLLDFGIAKLLTKPSNAATVKAMTPEYASPEQLLGRNITTASDIYSLGVLLFVMLADRLPYGAGAEQPVELMRAICEEDPVWEPAGPIRGDLRSILTKALHKDPQRRYLSVEQFAGDIRRYMEGLPVLAMPDSFLYRARKFVVRRAFALAAVAALLLVALVGGLSTMTQWRRGEQRFNEVRSLARSMLFDVYDSITPLPGSVPARRIVVSRAQQYLDKLAGEAGNDPDLLRELAESYLRLGDVLGRPYRPNLGDTEGALTSYRKAQTLMERTVALRPGDAISQESLLQSYMNVSRILERQNKVPEGIEVLQRGIRLAEALHARDPKKITYIEDLARVTQYLGQAQYHMADQSRSAAGFQHTLETYQKALEIHQSAGPQSSESWQRGLSIRYQYIGYALRALGDCTGDVSYYRRALEAVLKRDEICRGLARSHAGQPDAAITRALAEDLNTIGLLRWKCCGDLNGALRDLGESRESCEKLAAADPQNLEARRDLADVHSVVGEVLAEAGRKREAFGASLKALVIYEELARADPSSMENAGYVAKVRARMAGLQK